MKIYWECRDNKLLPAPGGPGDQSAFAMELLDFLDGIVNEAKLRSLQEQKKAQSIKQIK